MLTTLSEKLQQRDTLTSLSARNSLLLDRPETNASDVSSSFSMAKTGFALDTKDVPRSASPERYGNAGSNPMFMHARADSGGSFRPLTPNTALPGPNPSRENLVAAAAPVGGEGRQPTLPDVGGGGRGYSGRYSVTGARGYGNQGPQPGYGQGQGGGYGGGYGYRY
jgi:hypothetical protein